MVTFLNGRCGAVGQGGRRCFGLQLNSSACMFSGHRTPKGCAHVCLCVSDVYAIHSQLGVSLGFFSLLDRCEQ